jgi:indole-3-glycerol phosphate synthase
VVSESGIKNREDIARLQSCGVQAALVGETLMTAPDIALKMKELM